MHKTFELTNDHKGQEIYICPKCFRMLKVKTTPTVTIDIEDSEDRDDLDAGFVVPVLAIACERCEEIMFECDYTFADRIIDLNKLGFYTLFHCEGHAAGLMSIDLRDMSSEYGIGNPYLTFDWNRITEENQNLILDSVCESDVYVDDSDCSIAIRPITQDDTEFNSFEDKESYVNDARAKLYRFVDILIQKAKSK